MVARTRKVMNNPVRAETIAQTENANAYQSGLLNIGIKTGAKRKVYEGTRWGLPDLCATRWRDGRHR